MKGMKKLVALLLAVSMVASMVVAPASAATSYTTVKSPGSFSSNDSEDNTLETWYYYTSDASLSDQVIEETSSGKNIVIVENGATVNLDNLTISMLTEADGSDTNDFTGKGTAIAAYDANTVVNLSNSTIKTSGVATMPIFVDNYATMNVTNTKIYSYGGTLNSDYVNTANQSAMVAPPWVLGIMGTSRASNLMGTNSTLNFLDSEAYAGAWAVLSTDSGTNMVMNIVNSKLELLNSDESVNLIQAAGGQITTYDNPFTSEYGSGYGTYVIGSVVQNVIGSTFNVGTYAAIFTGGTMNFSASEVTTYTLSNGNGTTTTYQSTVAQRSAINSDCFGFMAHQNTNYLNIQETDITTGNAVFLIKTGGSSEKITVTVSDSTIETANNVLIQLLDNEDDKIGIASTSTMAFATSYSESAGWTTSAYSSAGSYTQTFTFSDMDLSGNIYNGSGTQLAGQPLVVTLSNVTYDGAVASTSVIHINETGEEYLIETLNGFAVDDASSEEAQVLLANQLTTIGISNYYYLGHVANLVNDNGTNKVTLSLTNGTTWYVTGTSLVSSLTVSSDSQVIIVGDATLTVNGTVYSKDNLGSYSWVESYGAAAKEELEFSSYTTVKSPGSFSSNDSDDNSLQTWLYYTTDAEVANIIINDSNSGKNAIIVESKANVTIDNVEINLITTADGDDTNDFTGKGTAVAAYDSGTTVTLTNSEITTAGVATMPIFVDNGATMTVEKTVIISKGGTLNSSYVNTANQSAMVAPPWVLGIMGTSRASNLMGTQSTLNFLASEAYAGAWAVLSTDSGTNMVMNIVNSKLELLNSDESVNLIQAANGQITTYDNPFTTNYGTGYGTYVIGSVVQNVIGSTFNVGTYAAIFTGGTMNFSASEKTTYTLSNADGSTQEYTSTKAQRSAVNSDVFGFMAHQNTNYLNIEQTDITTGNAVFLIKTGGSSEKITVTVSDSTIETANNVLIQILDNEDDKIGIASTSTMAFATSYSESAGWTTSAYSSAGSYTQTFTFSDMELSGNIYNGSGTQLAGQPLVVTLSNVEYTGAVASTSVIHIDEVGEEYLINTLNGYAVDDASSEEAQALLANQLTTIGISNYYYLGHVANLVNYNGTNKVTLSLTNGTTWYVTGTSLVYSLTISSDSEVVIVGDATLTVNGTVYSQDNLGDNMTWLGTLDQDACEHDYTVVTTPATCTTAGSTVSTCANCGKVVTTTIKATGHSYVAESVENADGSVTTTYTCSTCGDTYTETVYPAAKNTDTGAVYETLQEAINAASSGETIVLLGDVTESITVSGNITLDLGGYTVTGDGSSVVYVSGTLVLENGTLTGGTGYTSGSYNYGGGMYVTGTGNVTLNDVIITGNTCTYRGAGIYITNGGTVTMNSGEITNNVATTTATGYGGGVFTQGTFIMNGGVITGNTITSTSKSTYAGGLYVGTNATFEMNGGYIYGNTAGTAGMDIGIYKSAISWTLSGDFGTCVDAEGHLITGWYIEASGSVWSESNITAEQTALSGSGETIYLVAAHGEDATYPDEEVEEFAIISWPESATAAKGTEVDFTVVTTGEGVTYQWYFQTATGSKWYKSTGGTESVLTITATDARNGYKYYVVVTDAEGNSYTSEVVTLTVGVIVAQPESITAAKGETATFSVVTVDGCTYQWQYKTATGTKWYSWDGATEATFDVTAIAGRNGYSYRCKITTADGTVYYTDEAVLTVE